MLQNIRCNLVYKVIEPVAVQAVRCCPPCKVRSYLCIIIRVIIIRNFGIKAFGQIPLIFTVKRQPVIFKVSKHKYLASVFLHYKQIADFIAADEARIVELKGKLERPETSLEEKEKISKEVDELTRRIDDKIEDKLDEILPEAFAVMKDTARRFLPIRRSR